MLSPTPPCAASRPAGGGGTGDRRRPRPASRTSQGVCLPRIVSWQQTPYVHPAARAACRHRRALRPAERL